MSATPKLFAPIRIGNMELSHRVVMAPMTRTRNTDAHEPTDLAIEYYTQRASTPGTLLISEGTIIADKATGHKNVPGIWSDTQIALWKKITDAVHAKGSFIFMQLWALGRGAMPAIIEGKGFDYVSASPIPLKEGAQAPRALTVEEVKEYVGLFAQAAANAVKAGFDGVEVHGASGYIVDTFLQNVSNTRTDEYGGSIENRIRFADEVMDAIVAAVGPERAAIRLSPWGVFQGMGMPDPVPTFKALVERLAAKHPKLAYIHVIEPDAYGLRKSKAPEFRKLFEGAEPGAAPDIVQGAPALAMVDTRSNAFVDDIWLPRPVIHTQDFDRATALEAAKKEGVLIGFGRFFISNPDLPVRLQKNLPLTVADPKKLFGTGVAGYTDWAFAEPEAVSVNA